MARKVFISSDMSIDEAISEVAESDPIAALIWPWILTCFDDWGRAKASPREIKNSTFPANDAVTIDIINRAIKLYGIRLVRLYEVDGKPFMCIHPDKWFKYQTHIRREKRDNDGSKYPAPNDVDIAQVRASARDNAESRANLTNCIPSPSPSPSLSFTQEEERDEPKTAMDAYRYSFNKIMYTGHIQGYVMELMNRGFTDPFIREVFMEMGARGVGADERYMRKLAEDWISNGIYTRLEAAKRNEKYKSASEKEAQLQQQKAEERKTNVVPMDLKPDPILDKAAGFND